MKTMQTVPYTEYKYLYPPRPLNRISRDQISKYDNGSYIGQVKMDGSCCVVFISDNGFLKIMNRHNQGITNPFLREIDYFSMYKGGTGFMILCGELLNKNKKGENGEPLNKKFVIWDILCLSGEYLIGSTTLERLLLLEQLYPCVRMTATKTGIEMYDHLCFTGIKGVFKAPTYTDGFEGLYDDVMRTELYEGILLKRAEAPLNFGFSERNNYESILKCRRETKNFKF